MSAPLILKNLCAGYGQGDIIRHISLHACPGQNIGIIGPNGSGKSTLLRCLAGTLKPTSGEALLHNRPIAQIKAKNRAKILAAFTTEQQRPPYFTTLQMAALGRFPWLSWLGQYSPEDLRIAQAALEECGLASFAQTPVTELSSGQFQLAALARVLAQIWHVPQAILVLDELTANLDLANKLQVSLLLDKWRQKGHIIIQAMHDCNLAALFCTHLLGLKNGRQLFFGPVKDVFTREELSVLYDWPLGIHTHPDTGTPQIFPRFAPLFHSQHAQHPGQGGPASRNM